MHFMTSGLYLAATIFAYGQTSSGKTFTMRGITENAIKDIYEHIRIVSYSSFAKIWSSFLYLCIVQI